MMLPYILCSAVFFLAGISQAHVSLHPPGDNLSGYVRLAARFPKKVFWLQTTTYITESYQ